METSCFCGAFLSCIHGLSILSNCIWPCVIVYHCGPACPLYFFLKMWEFYWEFILHSWKLTHCLRLTSIFFQYFCGPAIIGALTWLLMRNASPRLPVVNKLILCSSGGFFFNKVWDFKFKIERKTPLSFIVGIMGSSQFETWKMGTAEVRISQLLGFWPVLTSPTVYWKYNIEYTFNGKH